MEAYEIEARALVMSFLAFLNWEQSKQAALLTIDKICSQNPTIKGDSEDLVTMIVQTKAYWQSVRQVVEKL